MRGQRHILIVEDDILTRTAMKAMLEWGGYRVDCAANGQEALEYLRSHNPPSLILLDWAMPIFDGRQFREEQQQDPALAGIPVVIVSGASEVPPDAAGYIYKPFEPRQLLETVWQQG
jgi:CheY-like chemotaxis protein